MVKRQAEEDVKMEVSEERRKPGQRYATPTPGLADRVFYETLYRQKPASIMAQDYCIAYGVLPEAEAEELYKLVCKRKSIAPSPTKARRGPPPPEPKAAKKASKAKALLGEGKVIGEGIADTGLDGGAAFEGVGTIGV